MPAYSASGSQSGSSIHGPTSSASSRSLATHVKVASLPLTARHSSSRSPKRIGSPVALNVPPTPFAVARTIQRREIADVDELHGVLGRARREHLAASRDAVRPVGEPARRVVRPDDEARAHDEGGVAEGFFDDPLAGRLARAVQLRVLVGLLPRRQLLDGSALHRAARSGPRTRRCWRRRRSGRRCRAAPPSSAEPRRA